MPYRCVLLDLDGTILDSTDMIAQSLAIAMQAHTGHVPSRAELIAGIGTPLVDQLAHHAANLGIADRNIVDAMVATYLEDNHARHDAEIKIFDHAKTTLDLLKNRGHILGIVTSKPVATAVRGLALFDLADHFDVVVGCDTVTDHKPHPAPVLWALKTLKIVASDAIYIGDSTHDIRSGNRAQVDTAGVLWGPYPRAALAAESPTYLLETFEELAAIVS